VERKKQDVVPALIMLAQDKAIDEIGLNVGVIHALWTLHGLGALDGSNPKATAGAVAALRHRSAGVRRNAVQVLPRNENPQAILAAGLLKDTDPQVRLAALLALAEPPSMPPSQAVASALLSGLDDGALLQDRWLTDALTSAAARHSTSFLPGLARQWTKPLPASLGAVVERTAEHLARGADVTALGPLLELLADANPRVADAVVTGLARGWPKDRPPQLTEATEKALVKLVPKLTSAARAQLVALASRWGSKALERHAAEVAVSLLAQARNGKETDASRIQAAAQLIDFRRGDADAASQLLALLTPRTSPELAQGLLEAVGRSESPAAGPALVEMLGTLTPGVKKAALRSLLARADWTELLLTAIGKAKVQAAELSLDQKQALANHPSKALAAKARELFARSGGLPDPNRQKVIDELNPLTKKTGNPAAGKLVFKNHCAKCHTHGGEGAKIGPDLTGMAVHTKDHLLVEILDPSRSVEGNYRQYMVTTRAGRTLTGLLVSENKTAIEFIDVEAKKHTLLREDIEELQASPKSLMPDGFEKQLKPTEIQDLLEFLTQRGKFLPLPLGKAATVVSTRGMFYSEESPAERLIFSDWSPKTFQGVPFQLVDPQGDRVPNVILLQGPEGTIPPKMPRSVSVPCNASARAIHLLSGVSGWGFPLGEKGSVTMIVRLHYADDKTEDHSLRNGEHFADYIRRVDVPDSAFAFSLRGQQLRYLAVHPKRTEMIASIEFVKGGDRTAPIVMAVTIEVGGGPR
jgi:uncharacterized protein